MATSCSYQGSLRLTSVSGPLLGKWTRPYLRHRLPLTLQETFIEFLCLGSFWQKSIDTRPSLQPTFYHATLDQNVYRNIFAKWYLTDWPGFLLALVELIWSFQFCDLNLHIKEFNFEWWYFQYHIRQIPRHNYNRNANKKYVIQRILSMYGVSFKSLIPRYCVSMPLSAGLLTIMTSSNGNIFRVTGPLCG